MTKRRKCGNGMTSEGSVEECGQQGCSISKEFDETRNCMVRRSDSKESVVGSAGENVDGLGGALSASQEYVSEQKWSYSSGEVVGFRTQPDEVDEVEVVSALQPVLFEPCWQICDTVPQVIRLQKSTKQSFSSLGIKGMHSRSEVSANHCHLSEWAALSLVHRARCGILCYDALTRFCFHVAITRNRVIAAIDPMVIEYLSRLVIVVTFKLVRTASSLACGSKQENITTVNVVCANKILHEFRWARRHLHLYRAVEVREGKPSLGNPSLPYAAVVKNYLVSVRLWTPTLKPLQYRSVARIAAPLEKVSQALKRLQTTKAPPDTWPGIQRPHQESFEPLVVLDTTLIPEYCASLGQQEGLLDGEKFGWTVLGLLGQMPPKPGYLRPWAEFLRDLQLINGIDPSLSTEWTHTRPIRNSAALALLSVVEQYLEDWCAALVECALHDSDQELERNHIDRCDLDLFLRLRESAPY
mmetsp:Transcript_3480/g.6535  ORF Transcript_3480/g.6535 Transcript_3480/m.6535 type:complete len:470 (-) Transcript_3480:2535-3944(-)